MTINTSLAAVDRREMIITQHAVLRYQQRVEPVSADIVRERLSGRAFVTAIAFGAKYVILSTGARAVIEGKTIVTVLPKEARLNAHYGDIKEVVR